MKRLVLLSGKKRTGKDTLANYFKDEGFAQLAFSDALKRQLYTYLTDVVDVPVEWSDFYKAKTTKIGNKFSEEEKELRSWLQHYGQFAKLMFGKYYWSDIVVDSIKRLYTRSDIIISDARFPYELERIKSLLDSSYDIFTIRIKRNTGYEDNDISETALDHLDDSLFDFVVDNNGTLEDLKRKYLEIAPKIVRNIFLR